MNWIHRLLTRMIRNSLLSGMIAAFLTLIVCALCLTLLIETFYITPVVIQTLIYASHGVAIAVGAAHTALRRKKRGLFHGIRIAVAYSLLIALASFLIWDSGLSWQSWIWFTAALLIGGWTGMRVLKTRRTLRRRAK